MRKNRPLPIIIAAVTLDTIGVGLMFPILPALMREMSGSDEVSLRYGAILAVYALMQFLFSPVLGALSDRFGRRPVLLASMAGATVDYLFMAFAPALWMIFIGRAIAGLSSASMAVATAVVADITTEEDRARRFGYLNAAFGLGFVAGPMIGGVLGAWNVRAPFAAAAILTALNLLFALFWLPETRPAQAVDAERSALGPLSQIRWALLQRGLRPLLLLYFAFSLVGQVYGATWVLFCEDRFGWGARLVGISLSAYGLFHAATQAFLAGPVTARLGSRLTIGLALLLESTACLTLAFTTQGWALFALVPLFSLSGIGLPAHQSLLSGTVGADVQGRLQGVLASLVSLSAIIGPLIFSALYAATREGWNGWVWVAGVGIYVLVSPVLRLLPASKVPVV